MRMTKAFVNENRKVDETGCSCCPPRTPFVRATPKIGRNEPCPCGSGRKYKKCCGKPR